MGRPLVIVESPAKARTIGRYLGDDFVVAPSVGHVRDLPERASEVPKRYRDKPWARLGVDVDNDFEPLYVIPSSKKEQVARLTELLEDAPALYLATDEDREGESISWHLKEVLDPRVPVHRLVFHEITEAAIRNALNQPRDIDERLVRAQEARRILDRLVGYEVSPLLWKKIRPKLSAGRVQSVAVRLVVERERRRMGFTSAEHWDLSARFQAEGDAFEARLHQLDGRPIASRNSFDPATGQLKPGSRAVHLDRQAAHALATRLAPLRGRVESVQKKAFTERPAPPFITSTLQQEANRKLRWSARRTMQVAQRLYENGWITYMRTDSTVLSQEAVQAARRLIEGRFGNDYLPSRPRTWKSRSKAAQEAHEAIRPAGSSFRDLEEARRSLDTDEGRLYELIWKRTVASQMPDARGTRIRVRVALDDALFQARGKTWTFPGYRLAYVVSADEDAADHDDGERVLPPLQEGASLQTLAVNPDRHETKPPPRLTEASLVKELEGRGIGRPSTYASIIDTIQARQYVFRKGSALVPTFTAFAVTNLLRATLSDLVDYEFTAKMEDDLDRIATGELDPRSWLHRFYDGGSDDGLVKRIEDAVSHIDAREVCTLTFEDWETLGSARLRVGRYGPYLEVDDMRVDLPEKMPPDELTEEVARSFIAEQRKWPRELGEDPETGQTVHITRGPFGFYVQLGEKKERKKPRRASLLREMEPEEVDLDVALALLSLPRTLGEHPETGEPVIAADGRYGPYVKSGSTSRSVPPEMNLLELDLAQATKLLSEPRRRGRGRRRAEKQLGESPRTGQAIRLVDGRYGPYVTDGERNASLPKEASADVFTLEQAVDLLETRGKPPRRRRKGGGGKTASKSKAKAREATSKGKGSKGKGSKGKGSKGKGSKGKTKARKTTAKRKTGARTKGTGKRSAASGQRKKE